MGFKAQPAPERPRILLIASLTDGSAKHVDGADAGLLRVPVISSGAKTIKELSQAVPDIPWGGWLSGIDRGKIKQLAGAGGDFVVFPASMPLALLQNGELGKVLEVEPSLSESLVRTVNELPVDAVLMATGAGHPLTWHHLMTCQHLANLLAKPILVSMPPEVTAGELKALWEAGVGGVIIEVDSEPANRLRELRRAIDKLAFTSPRRRGKAEARLPQIDSALGLNIEEEEEE